MPCWFACLPVLTPGESHSGSLACFLVRGQVRLLPRVRTSPTRLHVDGAPVCFLLQGSAPLASSGEDKHQRSSVRIEFPVFLGRGSGLLVPRLRTSVCVPHSLPRARTSPLWQLCLVRTEYPRLLPCARTSFWWLRLVRMKSPACFLMWGQACMLPRARTSPFGDSV